MSLGRRILIVVLTALALAVLPGVDRALAQQAGPRVDLTPIPMSDEEKAWLAEHKDMRLGIWLGSPPVMFRGEDGRVQGLVPTYVDIIEHKLGLKPKRVRASGFEAIWELAKAGEVDVIPSVTRSPDRADEMLFSEPYEFLSAVIVTRTDQSAVSGLSDLNGRIVAVTSGHVPHLGMAKDYPGIILMPVSSPDQGLRALEMGRADAFVGSEPSVLYLAKKLGFKNIRIGAVTEYSYILSVGIRKDWPILLELVNRALASIPEAERKAIHDYWTVIREGGWVGRPDAWRMVGATVAAALVFIGLFVVWNRKLAAEIARRKEAEAETERVHRVTEQVIESADVIIVGLDYSGYVRLLNRAGEEITGYSREEMIGKDWFDLVVPRERFPFVWDEFCRMQREGASSQRETFENPILTKSGDIRHILWRNSAADADSGLTTISFGSDITNRLLAEEELRLTQFAMDNAAVGILRVEPSAHIAYANRSAADLFGQTRSELRRKTISELVGELDQVEWDDFWKRLKYRQMLTLETTVRKKSGEILPVEVTAYYLLFKGTELAIAFFADISERKRIQRLRDDVERMVQHDLRSPALAVQTLFTLFRKADNLNDSQRELLESVEASSRRMIRIIDMSRALYAMESGTYAVKPEPLDLLALAGEVASELHPLMRLKKVRLDVLVGGESATGGNVFMVESEEMLCYTLLLNLLKNAIEASPEEGVVTLDCNSGEEDVVSIHNRGAIPESIRETFFNKYVTSGKERGTGLGTYTSHLIVTSLGGTIAFTSSVEDGTIMTVRLPKKNNNNS